jgi:hypothetical protein
VTILRSSRISADASGVAHPLQNRAPSALSCPQRGHLSMI